MLVLARTIRSTDKGANMTLTTTEQLEWARCAQAMYRRGCNAEGHLMSGCSAKVSMDIEQFDRAAKVYRGWLVFDEPKALSEVIRDSAL
jgi:hypothetical protein